VNIENNIWSQKKESSRSEEKIIIGKLYLLQFPLNITRLKNRKKYRGVVHSMQCR